jgi:PhzF family phenazine biosynthesis protein
MARAFRQVDVFTDRPYLGNPVAVIHDAAGLSADEMQQVANWTNLSETTFVLPPDDEAADYRVRIFTPVRELPFAGHPTLGTCHAWLEAGGRAARDGIVVQQCQAGLIEIRRGADGLAFAAPPLLRGGALSEHELDEVERTLQTPRARFVDVAWADNGPGWVAVLFEDSEEVLALTPLPSELDIGVVAPLPVGCGEHFEVRAFFPKDGTLAEDPVTGSLNASLAQWLIGSGRASAPYIARQGTALGRAGRVHVAQDDDGTIWIGGGTVTCVAGEIAL